MHLCFWLFFSLKTETTSNPIMWNRSILFSVFIVRFEGILSASTDLLWLTKPKFRIDNRLWALCLSTVKSDSGENVVVDGKKCAFERKPVFIAAHHWRNCLAWAHSLYSLYPSRTPIAWNKECSHSRRSNSYKNE